jgi:hypothetical protein
MEKAMTIRWTNKMYGEESEGRREGNWNKGDKGT